MGYTTRRKPKQNKSRETDNMWRYLEGVKPPQKCKTPEEKATYFRDYDKNKWTRSYLRP
jgi:hypothetical protein